MWKRKLNDQEVFWFRLTLFGATAAFALSLPPFIPLGGERRIYWLTYYLHQLLPMFRMYGRMGVMVLLFVTVGSVIALHYWLRIMENRARFIFAACICAALAFDLLPKLPMLDLEKQPAVYAWLAAQPGRFAIYEMPEYLPHGEKDQFRLYKQLYYQTFHKKRLANRGITRVAWSERDFAQELKRRDVRYVIQHTSWYTDGPIPKEYKRFVDPKVSAERYNAGTVDRLPSWYRLMLTIEGSRVYEVM